MPKDETDDIISSLKEGSDEGPSKERLQREVKRLRERVAQLEASHKSRSEDPDYFNERLAEEIARCSRYKYEFCLLLTGLDIYPSAIS